MTKRVLSIVVVALMASVSFGEVAVGPASSEANAVNLIYSPDSGNLTIEAASNVTTFELKSAGGNLTGAAGGLGGLFDVNTGVKLFKLDPAGFGSPSHDFGAALKSGLSFADLGADLTVDGSLASGGSIVGNIVAPAIPEPSSVVLAALAGLGLLGFRRK
ncbi:MAG: PEP-CTERM sorting domain-containing protein [Planctomycetales bacterium]|nr:PEP-CTERM sorting domain-containing protein [Planctomycetales bacterium]